MLHYQHAVLSLGPRHQATHPLVHIAGAGLLRMRVTCWLEVMPVGRLVAVEVLELGLVEVFWRELLG